MKQLTTTNKDVNKEFASFKVHAGLRPSFEPDVPQFGFQGTSHGNPVIDKGTFFDLLVAPEFAVKFSKGKSKGIPLKAIRKTYKAIEKSKSRKEEGGSKRGRNAKATMVSSIPYFNEVILRFIETAMAEAVPEDKRVVADINALHGEEPARTTRRRRGDRTDAEKEVFDGEGGDEADTTETRKAPRDVFRYYHNSLSKEFFTEVTSRGATLGKKVSIRKAAGKWVICLPIGKYKVGSYLNGGVIDPSLPQAASAELFKACGDYFLKAGIDVFNLSKFDDTIKYKQLESLAQHVTDNPMLAEFIRKYVVGFRVIADSAPRSTLDKIEGKVRSAGGAGAGGTGGINIVDETNPITPEMEDELNKAVNYNIRDRDAATNASLFRDALNREMQFYLVVQLPDEEAKFYVQANDAGDIRPNQILEYFRTLYANYLYPVVNYFFPMEEVAKKIQGYEAKPKVNDGNISIDKNNYVYYIPNVNNVELVDKITDAYISRGTGEYSYDLSLDEIPPNFTQDALPYNRIILTDWVNNKLSYTDRDGVLCILDMEDFYSARPYSMVRQLQTSYKIQSGDQVETQTHAYIFEKAIEKAFGIKFSDFVVPKLEVVLQKLAGEDRKMRLVVEHAKRQLRGNTLSLHTYPRLVAKYITYFSALERNVFPGDDESEIFDKIVNDYVSEPAELELIAALMKQVTFRSVMDDSELGKPLAEYLDLAVDKGRNDIERLCLYSTTDIKYLLRSFAIFYVLSTYRGKYKELRDAEKAESSTYRGLDVNNGMPGYTPKFKNVGNNNGDGVVLKNYQARIMSVLDKTPPFAILAVDAGGGKTILAIANILQELEKGNVKKPLVLCPSHLVKDYVQEVNWFTEGKMNAVVLTNHTFENYDQEQLLNLVQNSPINTVFIADYDVFRLGPTVQTYGSDSVKDYRYLNFFRTAGFDGVWCDESHYLKNTSERESSVRYAIAEIPLKRLMTGTFTPNRIKDIVRQFAFFDPSVFGSETQFEKLLEDNAGNVPETIRMLLGDHCAFMQVKRREWAAELPHRYQSFEPVAEMTPNQQLAYKYLCTKQMNKMRDLLGKAGGNPDDVTDNYEDDDDDEESSDANDDSIDNNPDVGTADSKRQQKLQQILEKNLAHVEVFLAAPSLHPLAGLFLKTKQDMISPKLIPIQHHLRQHFSGTMTNHETGEDEVQVQGGFFGKVLIFTSWKLSAEHIYNNLAAEYKGMTLRYYAEDKVALVEEFKTNPKLKIMIGIGRSLNTGLNLQFCSRLIFCETMWTPGELEQSLARIFRPVKPGTKDPRDRIFINHIVVDKTIDVLKTSNLVSKWVDVVKLSNYDNPIYDDLKEVDPIKLSIEKLSDLEPSFYDDMKEQGEAFVTLLRCEQDDFDDFKLNNPDKLEAKAVVDTGLLPGSKQLKKVPYTPGMSLFRRKKDKDGKVINDPLGLVPYNIFKADYIRQNGPGSWNVKKFFEDGNYILIHTEVGDGYAYAEGRESKGKVIDVGEMPEDQNDDSTGINFGDVDFDMDGDPDELMKNIDDLVRDKLGDNADDKIKKQLDDITGEIKDVSFETKKKGVAQKIMVKVKFLPRMLDMNPNDLAAITEVELLEDGTYMLSFNPDSIFVISADFNIRTDDVRNNILSQVYDIPVEDIALKFNPDKSTGTEESARERILKKLGRMDKKTTKIAEKEAERKAKQDEMKKKVAPVVERKEEDEGEAERPSRRGRGGRTVVPQEDEVQNQSINLYPAAARDGLALFADADDPDFDPVTLNRVMEHSKFVSTGKFTAIEPKTTAAYEEFINWLVPAIYDDEGTFVGYVMKDTPVIKNANSLKQKGKWMVDKAGARVISVDDFEAGLWVESSKDLPKIEVTEEARDMLNESFDQMAFAKKSGRVLFSNISPSQIALLDRLGKKKVPAGQISLYPVVMRGLSGEQAGRFYLCIDQAINSKQVIAEVVKKAKSLGFRVLADQREQVAFYAKKSDMVSDMDKIASRFTLGNADGAKESLKNIRARGRESAPKNF